MVLADILAARLEWEGTGCVLGGMSLPSPRHECFWLQLPHAESFKGLTAHRVGTDPQRSGNPTPGTWDTLQAPRT